MRWHILKTLIHKEALRHATNRGGLALAGLLVTASLLLAALNPAGTEGATFIGGVHHCYVDHEDESAWVAHLRRTVPKELSKHVIFRKIAPLKPDETIQYSPGTGAFQLRKTVDGYTVWMWHPPGDRAEMAVYEKWFWRESYRFFHAEGVTALRAADREVGELPSPEIDRDESWMPRELMRALRASCVAVGGNGSTTVPVLELKETPAKGAAMDIRAAIATALVMFALFFTCVYLMPSLTCEERERGLLLAQAISPATALEILTAKFLFYPVFGIFLATLLAGIHSPAALGRPYFWLAIITLAVGSLGIGMSIASLAKTQRAASLGALCYMLAVALVLLVCQQNNISFLPALSIEYHAPNILHATLTDQLRPQHWVNLLSSAGLAFVWLVAAVVLFRKRGWQ